MGVINIENDLTFKSSDVLFDRVKKRLRSFDAEGLIDDGDFTNHVKYILDTLGRSVYKECSAVIPVENYKAKLPGNFKFFYSAHRCGLKIKGGKHNEIRRPWVFQYETELERDCETSCAIDCCTEKHTKTTKVVIRQFVNDEIIDCAESTEMCLLTLSPNVRDICIEDCPNPFCPGPDEITIQDRNILTRFTDSSIFIQYYGLALDKFGLPMIPDNNHIEKAIEYYIYTQLFEEFYWNKEADGIERMLADARVQFTEHMSSAVSFVKLPSFQRMINSIRRQRSNRKFYYFAGDRTYS